MSVKNVQNLNQRISNKIVQNYLLNYIRLFFCVAAVCIAFICNKKSQKHNKYLMAVVAFLFPEIYLSQVIVRKYILNDYSCKSEN